MIKDKKIIYSIILAYITVNSMYYFAEYDPNRKFGIMFGFLFDFSITIIVAAVFYWFNKLIYHIIGPK